MNHAKLMFKIAHRLCDTLVQLGQKRREQDETDVAGICQRMHRVLHDNRLFNLAIQRQWLFAADKIQLRLRRNLSDLYYGIQSVKTALDQTIPAPPKPSEVLAELMQMEDEFGQIQINPRELSVSVVTDPITLEDVSLGSFQIKLFVERISRMYKEIPYRVIATDPNPAGADSSITHPHVSGEYLCEGEGHLPIRKALEQGRLCDFFNLVVGILNTYNPDSPYVSLDDWQGYCCYDCGRTINREDSYFCEQCDNDFCPQCSSYCQICDTTICLDCAAECPRCLKPVCANCAGHCLECHERVCRDCLDDPQICTLCQENRKENDDEHDPQNNTPAPRADAAV